MVISSAYFNVTLTLMEYSKIKQPTQDGESEPPDNKFFSMECDGDYYYIGASVPQVVGLDYTFKTENGEFLTKRIQHFYGQLGFIKFFDNDSFLEPSIWVKYAQNAPFNADINLRYQLPISFWIGTGLSAERVTSRSSFVSAGKANQASRKNATISTPVAIPPHRPYLMNCKTGWSLSVRKK